VYFVQGGDNLSRLALATGSSLPRLMLANCLNGTTIYVGQRLYVPRLPILAATATPTGTASIVPPSFTPTGTSTYTIPVSKPSWTATFTSTATVPTIMPSLTPSYMPTTPIVLN
jgi:LysM repeat protein